MEFVVLNSCALAKARSIERASKSIALVYIGDGYLDVNDVLSTKSWNGCGTDVIDSNRGVADQLADTPCDLLEIARPVRLIRDHNHRARLFCDVGLWHITPEGV
jgi:hypothetical protein